MAELISIQSEQVENSLKKLLGKLVSNTMHMVVESPAFLEKMTETTLNNQGLLIPGTFLI